MLRGRIVNFRLLLVAIFCGIIATLGTGTISNESGVGLPEIKRYGYPIAWLVTNLNGPTQYLTPNFVLDTVFWLVIALLMLVFLKRIVFPSMETTDGRLSLVLLIVLFIPISLLMASVHECGHAILGISAGGTLDYMKIAYLEIYPKLAMSHPFQLGLTIVSGLGYGSAAYGLMLLGGSMTTHIASWILGIVLLIRTLGRRMRVVLKVFGLFGFADLPFYIVFPQIGLRHWVFLGGNEPEPLIGARMMGIPDLAFYLTIVLLTLGLAFLYSETFRSKISTTIKGLLRANRWISAGLFLSS